MSLFFFDGKIPVLCVKNAGDWRSAVDKIVTREGTVIESVDDIPEKVFVLSMGESYFFPVDTIGEVLTAKLPKAGVKTCHPRSCTLMHM
jgi:hypothetical protein